MDFEQHLEPIRPEFENKMKKNGEKRINPVTGVFIFQRKFKLKLIKYFFR
jgi:hypothetical protein